MNTYTPEPCRCHGLPTVTLEDAAVCPFEVEGADALRDLFLDLIDPEREHTGDDE